MNHVKALWTLVLGALIGLMYYTYEWHYMKLVWDMDFTKISFLVLIMFWVGYIKLGYKIFKNQIKSESDLDAGFEICEQATALGLLGTVIGIAYMMKAFAGIDFDNHEQIKGLIGSIGVGMSTSLYTTLAGLLTQIFLRFSYYYVGSVLIVDEPNK